MGEPNTIHFELILGRRVIGVDGKPVGRIEEAVAEDNGQVREFHIGTLALVERVASSVAAVFGGRFRPSGYVVEWKQIDFEHPEKPRLVCGVSELRPLSLRKRRR